MADGSRPGPALAALSALTGRRRKLGPARNKVLAPGGEAGEGSVGDGDGARTWETSL